MYKGPYRASFDAEGRHSIAYVGNGVFPLMGDLNELSCPTVVPADPDVRRFQDSEALYHLHKIDAAIFASTVNYFFALGADWCNLPLTTRMISSPGEVYAGQHLNYTTDALPVRLKWFDNRQEIFLAESSQFYLELRLLNPKISKTFSIYNSFRKEKADWSHLSEFQHIEFEGKVDEKENIEIALGLLRAIVHGVADTAPESLAYYLGEEEATNLPSSFVPERFKTLTFAQAMEMLREHTHDDRYAEASLKNFGSWEEVALTSLCDAHIIVTDFPLMEIPFYHAPRQMGDSRGVARNADIILQGYREVVGSGVRISDIATLENKAKIFHLPLNDYGPYLDSRRIGGYKPTAGFGLGWQRLVHWMLCLPSIVTATHVARGEWLPNP
jgi:aspartyl/asparaginyl-tRNA synthetase